jgi:hypothetical protein
MSEIAKEIQADLNKTYAYFNAVLSSLFSANTVLFVILAVYSLNHNGIDTRTDMPAATDWTTVTLLSCASFVCLMVALFYLRSWYKRIKALEKRNVTAVISLIVYVVLIPVLGYASFLAVGALTMLF